MDAMSLREARSRNMRAVRGKDTKPELAVRRAAHGLGLRFRLCRRDLPGKPDLTLAKWRTVIFVNGCFWHQHAGCAKAALPKSNVRFWKSKLEKNVLRDQRNQLELERRGWRVLVIWECDVARSGAVNILRRLFPHLSYLAETTGTRNYRCTCGHA
ncbi:DNA mismatch endonuclease (patch repair protein) [Bradyrhizobium sp. USDA 4518]